MQAPSTSGSHGQAMLGKSNMADVMANWSLPEQFHSQAVRSINLLLTAASEGSFLAQAFTFDIPSGTSLTTLLVAARMIDSPADPDSPFSVAYATMNTHAALKQLTSQPPTYSRCFACSRCLWGASAAVRHTAQLVLHVVIQWKN